jgi:hypothetical protein
VYTDFGRYQVTSTAACPALGRLLHGDLHIMSEQHEERTRRSSVAMSIPRHYTAKLSSDSIRLSHTKLKVRLQRKRVRLGVEWRPT